MKKHIIAASVAAVVSAPAMAQNVSVYGLIDAGYFAANVDYGTTNQKQKAIGGLDSGNGTGTLSGSRLGFRGTEDLGGGLRAGFVYETAVKYSNGVGSTTTPAANATSVGSNAAMFGNTRQAFLELTGGFGGIRIGTQDTLAKTITEAAEPNAGSALTGAASLYQAGLITRRDSITYQLPTAISGLTIRAQVYVGENTTGGTANASEENKGTALSVDYSAGPLRAVAVVERIKNQSYADGTPGASTASNALVNTATQTVYAFGGDNPGLVDRANFDAVGASYNFGPATAFLLGTRIKFEDATAGNNGKIESQTLGLSVPMGALTLKGSIGTGKIKSATATTYDLDGYQFVAQYDLSKRTNAYLALGQTKYDSPTAGSDVKVRHSGVGIRHSF